MKKIAVFAGSFDPMTVGHLDVVRRASALFDVLWVVVAQNANKKNLFDCVARAQMVKSAVVPFANVKVAVHEGLTVDFMKSVGANFLVRGIRGASDLDFEQSVAWNNRTLSPEVETVFLLSASENLAVSSSVVRELLQCSSADERPTKARRAAQRKLMTHYVPSSIVDELLTKYEESR